MKCTDDGDTGHEPERQHHQPGKPVHEPARAGDHLAVGQLDRGDRQHEPGKETDQRQA